MNVPETDTDVPMPQIVSNSPTHSLPNVSYSCLDAGDSTSRPEVTSERTSVDMPAVEITEPFSELDHTATVCPLDESGSVHSIAPPVLQRAVSTSPRLEHISNNERSPGGTNFGQESAENDLLFFPIMDTSDDVDKAISLSSGCLDKQNGHVDARSDVRASDTFLSTGTALSNGRVSTSSLERIRSGIQRVVRLTSLPNSGNVGNPHLGARKGSITSSRSGAGNWHGSSIFGSRLFESASSTSTLASQRINVVASSANIEPVFSDCYSTSCDECSFPHGELPLDNQQSFVSKTARFRTSSVSSDLPSERFPSSSESVALQRTRSLPSKHATATPTELQDEASDSLSDLSPVSAVSGSTTKRRWQMTMPELTEGPENDSLSSHGQKRENLAAAALAIVRGEYKDWSGDELAADKKLVADDAATPIVDIRCEKRRYVKNLLVMNVAYFFLFSSYFALRNLQSSLNAVGGLGMYALSSMYCSLVFGSLFSTTVVQRLRPKRTLSLSLIGFVLYSAANFYPRFYTMIPASVVHGFFMAVGYTAQSTYLTNISAGYAELVGKQTKDVLSQFHGTYVVFLQFSQLAGGLVSSLLLSKPVSHTDGIFLASHSHVDYTNHTVYTANVSVPLCGSAYCPSDSRHFATNSNVDDSTLLVLMGCFGASTIAGCVILILFLNPLEGVMKQSSAKFSQQMTAVFRFFLQRRARLVIGLSFYSLLQISFMFGEFTKVVDFFVISQIILSVVSLETSVLARTLPSRRVELVLEILR